MAATPAYNVDKMNASRDFVKSTVNDKPVVLFSKSHDKVFSEKAKEALLSVVPEEKLTVVEVDKRPDIIEVQHVLREITGSHVVPRVFVAGEFIGGGNDTIKKVENGELLELLKTKGVVEEAA